jgi:flagellar protein FlbT
MSGLVLKLQPKERVLINGAILENGERRAKLCITSPGAHVLRLRDAIHPDEAQTPVRRVCYIAQLLLTGDADETQGRNQLLRGIESLSQVLTDHDSRHHLNVATDAAIQRKFYNCMKSLRELLPREDRLLAYTDE